MARAIAGRIVSVDSMKIYRRMDIGTATPPKELREEIPHYCIDIVEASESFSVARYVVAADSAIAEIRSAGSIPLAVGGTGLYVKALCEGLFEGPPADEKFRASLKRRASAEGLAVLHAELAHVDMEAAGRIHPNDEKRIVRALEVHHITGKPISELQRQWGGERRYDCVFIGLHRQRSDLHARINTRAKRMIDSGLKDEVISLLAASGGLSPQAAQGLGYAEMIAHLQDRYTLSETLERIKINTRRLAKKQRTWFRHWRETQWFEVAADEKSHETAERIISQVNFE